MGEEVFASYERWPNKVVKVFVSKYLGKRYIHIRELWRAEAGGEWQYGKGLTLSYDDVKAIDAVIAGLEAVRKRVVEGG